MKIRLLYLVLFFTLNLFAKGSDPIAVKGIIDLREISDPENFIVNLNGEWEFYWMKMIRPHDFNSGTMEPDLYGKVPSYWTDYKIEGISTEKEGFATYHLTVLLPVGLIKSMGVKMVLSGEGADEIFGGYLYFHKAPGPREFHEETVRKLSKLHLYDCLRANKSLAAWGVEGRVPFLDKEFLDVAMRINPADKMTGDGKMEKYVLRKAFEDYLPANIVWRQKEQFSDGVGYNWIDTLRALASKEVSDEQLKKIYSNLTS